MHPRPARRDKKVGKQGQSGLHRAHFQEAYGESMGSSCQTFRDGTTFLARDDVRLTSHSLLLESVGWV